MKKSIAILVLLALVAVGAFAQGIEMSAGGGLLFDYNARNGISMDIPVLGEAYVGLKGPAIGGFLFFDATYAEIDVNFAYGMFSSVLDVPAALGDEMGNYKMEGNWLQLGFGLLGKYPINLGTLTVFPLVGINYNFILSAKDDDGNSIDDASDFSQFGFLAGGGLDFGLSEALFLRGELLFQLRLPSKVMKDMADAMGGFGDATFGMGPRIKIGVGYKF